ncbi:MAG: hypothetical protein K6F53_11725 [Lachnospiraceae bacterium]|nr:hypothetical protein [Lachnospiraceae bacterium]
MTGIYIIPPSAFSEIGAVAAAVPYRSFKRDERRRDDSKKKKGSAFKQIFEKEAEKDPEQMGCFFEAKA